MNKTKICIVCKKEFPLTNEHFAPEKQNKDGFNGKCRKCLKEHRKQHYQKNKERYSENAKEYYQKNAEAIKKNAAKYRKENPDYMKNWREENKLHIVEYDKRYKKENKDRVIRWWKDWYYANKEYALRYNAKKRKLNPEPHRIREQQRRARKKKLPYTLNENQWQQIKNDFNNECAYCGMTEDEHLLNFHTNLHQEHFIPLSGGGEYTHNNIIPACISCNSSKRDKDFFEWYPTYEHYNQEREKFILEYLGYTTDDTQQLSINQNLEP